MITDSWLQYSSSNKYGSSYLQGFMDVSGNIILRNGSVNIKNGDISLNGNIYGFSNLTVGGILNTGAVQFSDNSVIVDNNLSLDFSGNFGKTFYRMYSPGTDWYVGNQGHVVSKNGRYLGVCSANRPYVSNDFANSWKLVFDLSSNGWEFGAISYNNKYWVLYDNSANSYPYISNDYGVTWTQNTGPGQLTWLDSKISNDGKYITLVTSTAVTRSGDYGSTWSTPTISGSGSIRCLAMSNDGQYQYILRNNSPYMHYSNNYGVTWTGSSGIDVAISYASSTIYFNVLRGSVSFNGKYITIPHSSAYVYTSSNYGVTYSQKTLTANPSATDLIPRYVCLSKTGQYQVCCATSTPSDKRYVFCSNDYGSTWSQKIIDTKGGTFNFCGIDMTADGKCQVAVPESSTSSYVSIDYGNTWTTYTGQFTSAAFKYVNVSENGQYIYSILSIGNTVNPTYFLKSYTPYNDYFINFTRDISVNGITIGTGGGDISSNTIIGTTALLANTTGYNNCAFGYQALDINTTGYNICAMGSLADVCSNNLQDIVIVGYNASVGGSFSTSIGSGSSVTQYNSTAIGTGTIVNTPNTIRLGNTASRVMDTSGTIYSNSFLKNATGYLANMMPSGKDMFPENTIDVLSISGLGAGSLYAGGVLAPNSEIYCIPYSGTNVGIIDPVTNTINTTTITGVTGSTKYVGGVIASNLKIYCVPSSATNVGIIDTVTNTIDTTTITGIAGGYAGGVLAPNGKIYCIPNTASTTIGIIDPSAATPIFSTLTITAPAGASPYFSGGVLAPNGKIYCIPSSATVVGVIDTIVTPNTFSTFGSISGTTQYAGGVLAPNGKIYCIPSSATNVGIIDPIAGTINTGTITGITGGYLGGVLAPNGKIYCIPTSTKTTVGVIDPTANTFTTFNVGISNPGFYGGVLAPNGKIYCIPYTGTIGGIIKTGLPNEPLWMLSPYYNKF
jgi:hypothetical protein